MSEPEVDADAAAAADADDTTLATTAVNSEGDDFATHVEKLIHSKKTETLALLLDLRACRRDAVGQARGRGEDEARGAASLSAGTPSWRCART